MIPTSDPQPDRQLRPLLDTPQTTRVRLRIGRRARLDASVSVTPAGLLAIGALVAATLLSVAPLLLAARRAR